MNLDPERTVVSGNTENMKFQCTTFEKSFTRNNHLKVHQRIHSEVKPFQCNTCGISFHFKSNLTVHMKTHNSDKNLSCKICEFTTKHKSSFNRHAKIHVDESSGGAARGAGGAIAPPAFKNCHIKMQ